MYCQKKGEFMTYYQFVEAVETKVKEVVDTEITVGIHTAEKMNGVKKRGIVLSQKGVNISPTIYLEEYFGQYQQGKAVEQIVRDIVNLYREVKCEQSWDVDKIQMFSMIESKIIYRVIHYEKNAELLKNVPHVRFLDLAITFCVLLEVTEHGTATMMVRNEHMEMWGVTKEILCENACKNTEKLLPYSFQTMNAVVEELTGRPVYEEEDVLYVLTNCIRSFGAATILYKDRLKRIGEYLQENYYILPSSIHEVILVPESVAPFRGVLNKMVEEINETQVEEEEILSDHAYYYDCKKGCLML